MKHILLATILFYSSLSEASLIRIDEKTLHDSFEKLSPLSAYSQVDALGSELNYSSYDDNFTPSVYVEGAYGESEEKKLSNFDPVTSIQKSLEFGVKKNTKYGASFKVGAFSSQFSNPFIYNSTSTGLKASVALDLYKDLLGRNTRKNYLGLEQEAQWKALESRVSKIELL